ncbi:MAG TPA: type I-B CRISPR-associated protein Cas7/Csh2 [Candidatus Saccharicenans sp.]|jgi:CRISPR-associated protein Csh2|nr:type I-B CRISPR-associated protein Cas7/Csh2 [Candidatus Saccharicenans sp.]HRD02900.1 type I-B CRISPR-associated protein Cas7/Csh2 [Candidatus Saccharicenans sp.]
MPESIKNRSEVLFLYDVKDANPNGDPVDENKPRIDEETGVNIVTDVRLKRTIRDYLHDYKQQEIFVLEARDEKGNLKTKEQRLKEFDNNPQEVINRCIDIRLFGATTAVEDKTMALTGPVQFKFGRSLHRVDVSYIKGTTVMPSGAEKKQGTFTERYIVPYSLIAFYGIVNETAASQQSIPLSEQDILLMLEAIWNGTKNLISGSKFGQVPRLLLQVVYKQGLNFYIGELDKLISMSIDKADEALRDISEAKIEVGQLIKALKENQEKIETIRFKLDPRISITQDNKDINLVDALKDFAAQELSF